MEILNVKNLSFSYPLCSEKAIDNISFSVQHGDFLCICAPTGSGKTTLLRLLKKELTPTGTKTGEILFKGQSTEHLGAAECAKSIGFVMQNPDMQIVTDKVWHELAFGAESLGIEQSKIRRLIAESASCFGIEKWFDKNTNELSGGQKQLLNLAAVMVTQPDLLILDEPTAQLDPVAATDFLSAVKRLNTELGVTVIITEHRTENVITLSNKLMIMSGGKITNFGAVKDVCADITDTGVIRFLPCAARLHRMLKSEKPCPVSISEGRSFITQTYSNEYKSIPKPEKTFSDEITIELKNVYFRYAKDSPDVLSELSLCAHASEVMCIMGGNGSGKSTALSVISGIRNAYSGSIRIMGKRLKQYKGYELYKSLLAMLPQNVTDVFSRDTVKQELDGADGSFPFPIDITRLYDRHPYDLSGGEQQIAALAKVLKKEPKILLLDEPTKGIDVNTKQIIRDIILELKKRGLTIIIVTHDVEFAADVADTCALFFRGSIINCVSANEFFSENRFYTTGAARITRGYYDGVLTDEQAVRLCMLNGERNN